MSTTSSLKIDHGSKLKQFGQEHLIAFWDELTPAQQRQLAEQLDSVDFPLVQELHHSQKKEEDWSLVSELAQAPPAITLADFADSSSYTAAVESGSRALAAGKVAMILVAGGQGSRLGFERPKGMFPIGPLSNRSLYQIHIEHLRARAKQFGTRIPMYIMSSPATHEDTLEFLAANQNFGLAADDLRVFCQGTMPSIDFDGKLILEQKHKLFSSPDGHGGMLAALDRSGFLAEMIDRGIEQIFYGQVDNPLIQICDPALIGYHLRRRSEMTSQVVRKNDPLQRVGNVVTIEDRVRIIEYSDLPESVARQTNADGTLKLWAGSIAVHIFETSFFSRSLGNRDSLPFHLARKKVPFINQTGELVNPTEPNAIKFERFIFDLLPTAENAIVCEVDPADGFCAVKNAPPAAAETPEHVKQAMINLHTRWLKEAGVKVASHTQVEINPLFALDPRELSQKLKGLAKLDKATYLHPEYSPE